MMTKFQAERLVRKIAELLGQPALENQAAKLAKDYTELADAASRRLEQCAAMIEAGEELQALQLAQTEPPLLDLITILSFRQASEWRAYCQTHNLQAVEPFYDKYVRQLNNAYGQKERIPSDDPLWEAFRRAMLKGDEEAATAILRIIAHRYPADPHPAQELKRLEDKALRLKLEELRQLLDAGDEPSALARIERLEELALPIPLTHPVWQRAQILRCQHRLRKAQTLRQQGAWQEAEQVVEDIRTLADQYELPVPPADAEMWQELEAWTSSQRSAFAADQDFQQAVAALEYAVDTYESKCHAGDQRTPAELQADFEALAVKWQEAERWQRPLDENLVSRCEQICAWLQSQVQKAVKRRRARWGVAALVSAAVLVVAGFLVWNWQLETQLVLRLKLSQSAQRVSEAERLLARAKTGLKFNPALAEAVTKAEQFVTRERDLKREFEQQYEALQPLIARGWSNALDQIASRQAGCMQALAKLVPEFQPDCQRRLAAIEAQWKPERDAQFAKLLGQGEQIGASQLNSSKGAAAVSAALPQVRELVAGMDRLVQPGPVSEEMARRYGRLTNGVATWTRTVDEWMNLQSTLPASVSVAEYVSTLSQLAQSPFASAEEREAAAELGRLQPQVWAVLTNLATVEKFRPEQPSEAEKEAYFGLRDDPNIQSVSVLMLTRKDRPDNPHQTHPVFLRGALGEDRSGKKAGLIYDPAKSPNGLRFEQQKIDLWDYQTIENLGLTKETDAFAHLGVRDLIDPNTGTYQKSALQLLDQLSQDRDSSSVFRAYLALRLFALAELRPMAWGIFWSPSAALHAQNLKLLGAGDLQSGSWLVPDSVDRYGKPLQKYFEQSRTNLLEREARFFQRLAFRTHEKGFDFAGFVDAKGALVMARTNASGGELWGWSHQTGIATLLWRRSGETWEKVADPQPLTPLFVFRGDRRQLLQETAKGMEYSLSGQDALLPPFFSPL